jgi:hypothetical protein
MAGQTTDTWTRTFTVQAGDHTVVVTEEDDGVNPPIVSATVDDLPAQVAVASELLIDGITPAIPCLADGGCTYLAIDNDDLAEHQDLNHGRSGRGDAAPGVGAGRGGPQPRGLR